jgi:hypothetical protein
MDAWSNLGVQTHVGIAVEFVEFILSCLLRLQEQLYWELSCSQI